MSLTARGKAARRLRGAARALLSRRLGRALAAAGEPRAQVAVSIVDDGEMRELNRSWRGVDKTTDVLSFAMREGEGGALHPDQLGDLVISIEEAERQAREGGRSLDEELLRLGVHGLVHLLGYDHATLDEERRMFAWEDALRTQAAGRRAVIACPRP